MIHVLFGTMTGNAEDLANDLVDKLKEAGQQAEARDVADMPVSELQGMQLAAVIISTWGEGDPPDSAEEFCFDVYDGKPGGLSGLSFGVCSLGDSSYEDFCGCGRKVEEALVKQGATKIVDRVDLDVDFEDGYEEWAARFIAAVSAS